MFFFSSMNEMTWTLDSRADNINILVLSYHSLLCCFLCCSPALYVGQILLDLISQTSVCSLRRSGSRLWSSLSFLNKNTSWISSYNEPYFIFTRRNINLVCWSMVRSIGFKWDEEICRIGMDDSGQEFDIKRLKHYWSHSFRWKIKWSIDHII